MTEQEKREKRIEEMCEHIPTLCCYPAMDTDLDIARELYDAGYRKAYEVKKEVFSKLIEVSKNFDGALPIGVLKAWAIEFGVEVEE